MKWIGRWQTFQVANNRVRLEVDRKSGTVSRGNKEEAARRVNVQTVYLT